MGNGFNDADRLTTGGHGTANVILEQASGRTNAQRRADAEVSTYLVFIINSVFLPPPTPPPLLYRSPAANVLSHSTPSVHTFPLLYQALVRNDVGTLIEYKPETTEIELFKKPDAHKVMKPKTKALDEDVYLSGIAQIIRRDFFPETAKLEAQHAYMTAMENNDVEALNAIYERYVSFLFFSI